ncbi:MAG: hypothetical protein JST92_19185 [Deltaproteobacteria bacterium]|nr:hypothetical protein [Deltaproteobacteria bacterium]
MRNAEVDRQLTDFSVEVRRRHPTRPVIVGINGPQGSGKSTLAALLVQALHARGLTALALSVDDFYLTHAEQRALAAAHPGNRALEFRGYPGTHDVALGTATLTSLLAGKATPLPRYDKSAHAGRGDRAPASTWSASPAGLEVILFEGWMLGFRPVPSVPADLEVPNQRLPAYDAWTSRLDTCIAMKAGSLDDIVRWRVDSERARRDRGETALSDAEARDYIERFLPAYRAWANTVEAEVTLQLDAERTFVSLTR